MITILLLTALTHCVHTTDSFACVKYVTAYDGDTVTVEIPHLHPFFGVNAKVRIKGIDAPEMRSILYCEKQAALISRNFARNSLKSAKRIDLKDCERGKYFRIVCDVRVDGKDLGILLKATGNAVTMGRDPTDLGCLE